MGIEEFENTADELLSTGSLSLAHKFQSKSAFKTPLKDG